MTASRQTVVLETEQDSASEFTLKLEESPLSYRSMISSALDRHDRLDDFSLILDLSASSLRCKHLGRSCILE